MNIRTNIISIVSVIFVLILWEVMVNVGIVDGRFFPGPSSIFNAFIGLLSTGELLEHFWISLSRLGIGYLLGAIPALIIGMIMGLSTYFRAVLYPIVAATYPIPKSAVLPLIILIFGLGEMSKIVAVAIGVFYIVLLNSMAGVLNLEQKYLDVGRNFKASRFNVFFTIALPGASPQIFTGLKLSMGIGLILIVMAEMLGANSGIGYKIWDSWQVLSIDKMYVYLAVISVMGFVSMGMIDLIERKVIPWKTFK